MKTVRLAIVGTGGMANWHAEQFRAIRGVHITAVCDIDEVRVREFAARHAPDTAVFTDFAKLLRDAPVDAVSIVAPDAFHAPLALQALAARKHVLCEKPLATNHTDARRMVAAAKKARVVNMVNFTYRNSAALQKAAQLAAAGRLGEIVHVDASYKQSWLTSKVWGDWKTSPGWLWRLSTKHGSAGVLGDLGVHILDFASFPIGPIRSVQARLKTFDKLKGRRVGAYPLDANDSAIIQVEFANGALGVVHMSRWATGHANSLALAIHGTKGALRIDLDRSYDELEICLGADVDKAKWKTIKAPPVPTVHQRFITAIRTGVNGEPDFGRGAEIQNALDRCFDSDRTGRAIRL